MRKYIILILLVIISTTVSAADIYKQVRVTDFDRQAIEKLAVYDIVFVKPGEYIDIVLNEMEFEEFDRLAVNYEIIHDDLTSFYMNRIPMGTTMGGFHTYTETMAALDSLSTAYPALVTVKSSIGSTHDGNQLWVVKVSDNPYVDEDEPEIFINGLHHAREPITVEVCIEYIRTLAKNYGTDSEITDLVNNNEFFIMPIANPDGYEYNRQTNPSGGGMWRKNRKNNGDGYYGVDLNRNYPYHWGYDNSGSSGSTYSDTYRGDSPGSEPETQALMDFIIDHDFAWIMNFHSYASITIWSWNYYYGLCEDDDMYWELFGNYAEDTLGYDAGTAWQLLYTTNGDANDWAYGERIEKPKTFAITTEIGNSADGFWPEQARIPVLVAENIEALKNFSHKAYEIYKLRQPSIPEIISPDYAPTGQQFYIHWHTDEIDTFNTAIDYQVIERTGYRRNTNDCESIGDFTLDNFMLNSSRQYSGSYSLFSGSGDEYRATGTMLNRILVEPGDTLTFRTWYDIETDWDYAYVEASNDGGATWYPLDGNLSTSTNPNNHNEGHGITGSSSGWVLAKYYIDDYIGQEITIRFRYWTDHNTTNEGFYVDEIYPNDEYENTNILTTSVTAESLLVGPYSEDTRYFQVAGRDDRGDLSYLSNRFVVVIESGTIYLSGSVSLSDSPADLSGSIVSIAPAGKADTADVGGNYIIYDIPEGTYDITASHPGYYDSTVTGLYIDAATTLNFELEREPLAAPELIAPVNDDKLTNSSVYFNWSDITYATGYIIEIAEDPDFVSVIEFDSSLSVSEYTAAYLPNNRYYWRVSAFDLSQFSLNSSIQTFSVQVAWSASPPLLDQPENGYTTTATTMNFIWYEVTSAVNYLIEIAADDIFNSIVNYDSTITGGIYSADFSVGNTYWWRVKASNSGNAWTDYSEIRSFTIDGDPQFLPGDANGDGRVIGADVTYLVGYFRAINPAPEPFLAGDANGDCAVIGSDITYLVNYFRGIGSAPFRGDCEPLINFIGSPAEDLINGK